jgi:hypothetical protein
MAIELRHEQIADHEVDLHARLLQHGQRFYAIPGSQNAKSSLFQLSRYDAANTVIIFDYQHREGVELRGGGIQVEGLQVLHSTLSRFLVSLDSQLGRTSP